MEDDKRMYLKIKILFLLLSIRGHEKNQASRRGLHSPNQESCRKRDFGSYGM
jgi:hypothetical protein